MIINFFLTLSLFYIIFFGGISKLSEYLTVNYILFIFGIFFIFNKILYFRNIQIPNLFLKYLFISFLFLCISYISSIFNIGDPRLLVFNAKQFGLLLVNTIFFYWLIYSVILNRISPLFLSRTFSIFLVITIVLYAFQLSSNEFKLSYIDNFTALDEYWLGFSKTNFRGIGWQGLSIWDTSLAYAVMSMILYPLLKSVRNLDQFLWLVGMNAALLISAISGRTGMFLLMFFLCIQLISAKKIFISLSLAIFYFLAAFVSYSFLSDDFEPVLSFIFEIFYSFFNGNGFKTNSTNDLFENHLYIPNIQNFVYGDNYYINDLESTWAVPSIKNRPSDSTFVINYVSAGLLGIVITFLYINVNYNIIKISIINILGHKLNLFASILLIFFIFFIYIKAPPYFSQTFLRSMVFLWFYGLLYKKE